MGHTLRNTLTHSIHGNKNNVMRQCSQSVSCIC